MLQTQEQLKLTVILYDRKTSEAAVASIPLDADVTGSYIKTLISNFSVQNPAANPAYIIERDRAYQMGQFTGDVDIINTLFKQYSIPESKLIRLAGEEVPDDIVSRVLSESKKGEPTYRIHSPTPQLN